MTRLCNDDALLSNVVAGNESMDEKVMVLGVALDEVH